MRSENRAVVPLQAMLVGGEAPAPCSLAPRIMDNILLDGNISIIFSLGLAMLSRKQRALMKQSQETLAATLKSLPMHVDDIEALLLTAYDYNIKDKHISGARAA